MPDYTIGIAERIASLPDSYATSNSVNRNYFQETSQSVVNTVNVAIAPAAPTALDPTPQTTYATATDDNSVDTFGVQETPIVITLLATIADAGALAQYLIRSVPAYWFSNLSISLNTLSDANKNVVANLEIGQQIAVTKTFPAGVVPQTVTEYLFVEGISHNITVESHVVTIYTGPASTYLQWVLGNYTTTTTRTNLITNPSFETNLNNWASGQTGFVRSTDFAYSGTNSLKVTVNTADSNVAYHSSSSYGVGSVTLSLYVYTPIGSTLAGRTISTSIEGGTATSTTTTNNPGTLVAGQWVRVSHIRNVTVAGTMIVVYRLSGSMATAAGQLLYFDAALGEQASSALPYFDGTYNDPYTGYTLTYQAWNGTANTSTSTTVWGLNSSGTGSALGDTTYGLA